MEVRKDIITVIIVKKLHITYRLGLSDNLSDDLIKILSQNEIYTKTLGISGQPCEGDFSHLFIILLF
ncbi:MAG: hypothetical protein ACFFEO_03500 [Candidatus Thorarchaeota archaeon]